MHVQRRDKWKCRMLKINGCFQLHWCRFCLPHSRTLRAPNGGGGPWTCTHAHTRAFSLPLSLSLSDLCLVSSSLFLPGNLRIVDIGHERERERSRPSGCWHGNWQDGMGAAMGDRWPLQRRLALGREQGNVAASGHAHSCFWEFSVALRGSGWSILGNCSGPHPWSSLLICAGAWCVDVVHPCASPRQSSTLDPPVALAHSSVVALLFCLEKPAAAGAGCWCRCKCRCATRPLPAGPSIHLALSPRFGLTTAFVFLVSSAIPSRLCLSRSLSLSLSLSPLPPQQSNRTALPGRFSSCSRPCSCSCSACPHTHSDLVPLLLLLLLLLSKGESYWPDPVQRKLRLSAALDLT